MTDPALQSVLKRLENAADELRGLRLDPRSLGEAVHTKIDVERAIRRVLRDLQRLLIATPTAP